MFELHITCSKDIDKLKIDFTDGSSIISEKDKNNEKSDEKVKKEKIKKSSEDSKDFDGFESYKPNQKIIKPIELPEIADRPVKIDNILNDFEI